LVLFTPNIYYNGILIINKQIIFLLQQQKTRKYIRPALLAGVLPRHSSIIIYPYNE
jgi:hypothetical protein